MFSEDNRTSPTCDTPRSYNTRQTPEYSIHVNQLYEKLDLALYGLANSYTNTASFVHWCEYGPVKYHVPKMAVQLPPCPLWLACGFTSILPALFSSLCFAAFQTGLSYYKIMAILNEVDRWGPPLEQYLHSQQASSQGQIGGFTSLGQLQASIAALDDPASVTYSTLEDILSVTSHPHELIALGNIQLTQISFNLLQTYMKSNNVSGLSI